MTRGCVTARREAVVSVRVVGGNAREEDFQAVIDTGFNGHLVIPIESWCTGWLFERPASGVVFSEMAAPPRSLLLGQS